MSRRTLINLVFFLGVFFVMIVWAVGNIVTIDALEKPYSIKGEFAAASGVKTNAEVTYLGVHYGHVAGVTRIPGGVRVTMKIDKQRLLPAGSVARIFRKSAIGEPYIDFVPPKDFPSGFPKADGSTIAKGEVVPKDRTTVPLEFSELLRSASAVISSIDPDDAKTLVHELALTLKDNSDSLRDLTTSSDKLTSAFVERSAQLDRLATNNTRITKVVASHRHSLGQSLTNLSLLAESLRNANGDTKVLLDRGSQLMGTAADLVSDEKRNLDCVLRDLEHLTDVATTDQRIKDLHELVTTGPKAFGYVWAVRDNEPDGVWVRVNLLANPEDPPPAYVPPHTLPAIPVVPACQSTLGASSSAAPFTPSQAFAAAARSGGGLPATGGQPLSALGLLLLAGAIASWRLRRPRVGA
jgi:phospholipid/cholesterol/gamma-HCH transport system substrate-binding protein